MVNINRGTKPAYGQIRPLTYSEYRILAVSRYVMISLKNGIYSFYRYSRIDKSIIKKIDIPSDKICQLEAFWNTDPLGKRRVSKK